MNTKIGLWLDHRKAVIVIETSIGEEIQTVWSHADKQPGRVDGERVNEPFESNMVQADDVRERRFASHLTHYYQEIAALVQDADSLFIFGPGEAKGELRKYLQPALPKSCRVHVETADKLTDTLIAARVRSYFQHKEINHPI